MKTTNADSIIEYLLSIIVLLYIEYIIGIEIVRIYNIKRIVVMSFFIMGVLIILITFYIIRTAKFSEFSIKRLNLNMLFFRVLIIIYLCFPLAIFLLYGIENMNNSVVLLFLSIFIIVNIIVLRIYYISTINKNAFHYCSVFYCVLYLFLAIISFYLVSAISSTTVSMADRYGDGVPTKVTVKTYIDDSYLDIPSNVAVSSAHTNKINGATVQVSYEVWPNNISFMPVESRGRVQYRCYLTGNKTSSVTTGYATYPHAIYD